MTDETSPVMIEGGEARDTTADLVPFSLPTCPDEGCACHSKADVVYVGTRPKMMVLLDLAATVGLDDEVQQMRAFNLMFSRVMDEKSLETLRARLRDPADHIDLDSPEVAAMFRVLLDRWFGGTRPTGGRPGSRRPSSRTSRRSTARSRSTA